MTSRDGKARKRLESRFENPIFKQVGQRLAAGGGLSLNDWSCGKWVKEASHGTHVAGIVFNESRRLAELHAAAFYGYSGDKEGSLASGFRKLEENIKTLAPRMKDYQSYVKALRDGYVEGRTGVGRRFSDYIKSVDCGVLNISYSEPQKVFKRLADLMRSEYQSRGANPKPIETYKSPAGMDLGGDLALELQIAFAPSYSLAIAENPDVLFVIAAGNETENVDERMSLPAFISRFFLNVLTVASVGPSHSLSSFSNRFVHG
jgi:subtilisin family serine protease